MRMRHFGLDLGLDLSRHLDPLEARLVMSRDTLGPVAPDAIVLAAGSDTGVAGDFITADRTPEFAWRVPRDRGGLLAAGTSSRYEWRIERVDEGAPALTAFGSAPTRGATTPLADGDYRFSIRYQDNGNRWGDWGHRAFTISSSAPLPPSIRLIDSPFVGSTETGSTNPAFELGPASAPYAEFYTALRLSTGETIYGISQSNVVRPAESLGGNLPEGNHTLCVRARDLQGNLNENWSGLTFTVDRTGPVPFQVEYLEQANASMNWYFATFGDPLAQDRDRIFWWNPWQQDLPTFYWQVHDNRGSILSHGRIDQRRFWSPPLAIPGAHTLYVAAADPVGNLSPWTTVPLSQLGVFDLFGPAAPPGLAMLAADDTGTVGDSRTTNRLPRFTWDVPGDIGGRAIQMPHRGGSTVTGYASGTPVGTSSQFRWEITGGTANSETLITGDENTRRGPSSPLEPGQYTFRVSYVDLVGNVGTRAELSFEILPDLQPPIVTLDSDTGWSASDGITNARNLVFSVAPPAAEETQYTEYLWAFHRSDGTQFHGVSQSATIRPSDTYAALSNLADGQHVFFVRARSTSGALTPGWSERVVNVDTQGPATIPSVSPRPYRLGDPYDHPVAWFIGHLNAPLRRDVFARLERINFLSDSGGPSYQPPLYRNMSYQVQTLAGDIVAAGIASSDDGFRIRDASVLDGTYRFFAAWIDDAGNVGSWAHADNGEFIIDSTPPTAPNLSEGPLGTLAMGSAGDFSWLGSQDSGPGPVRYAVRFFHAIGGIRWWESGWNSSAQSFTLAASTNVSIVPTNLFGPGIVRWSVIAFDQAGNTTESDFREFTLV